LFLLFGFFFCQVCVQQDSILFGQLKVSQARLELVACVPAGWLVGGWWPFGAVAWWQQCGTGSFPVLSVYHGVEKPSMG
jgi:hypothetical protein